MSSTIEAAAASPIKTHLAEHMLALADKLQEGSPSVYRLNMRDEMKLENSMIARKSIGQPYRNGHGENEKVFLVVGATGAGKSTLINGMVNYILDVEWKDDFRFKIITEDDKLSQADSQTRDIRDRSLFITWGGSEDLGGDHLICRRTEGGISRN